MRTKAQSCYPYDDDGRRKCPRDDDKVIYTWSYGGGKGNRYQTPASDQNNRGRCAPSALPCYFPISDVLCRSRGEKRKYERRKAKRKTGTSFPFHFLRFVQTYCPGINSSPSPCLYYPPALSTRSVQSQSPSSYIGFSAFGLAQSRDWEPSPAVP